ncbi:MAG TPA: alpha/beta hydrolase [Gammaproteobacteria bacterium]|nr:alpha/beta hydrolase [Gammaproteobacteria bacterium]
MGLLAIALSSCGGLFFVPEGQLILTPRQLDLDYQTFRARTPDGANLHGWLLPGKPPVKGSIVFLHGNAQNISYHIASVRWLPAKHYNVALYDYRGFGLSTGHSTLANAMTDLNVVLKTIDTLLPQNERRYAIFGQSLGASLAIGALAERPPPFPIRALIIDSAFSGFRRIAREKMSEMILTRPLSRALQYLFPASPNLLDDIGKIRGIPLLVIHGKDDQIVPSSHAQRLYARANEPKPLILQEGAKHIQSLAWPAVRQRMLAFLDQALSTKSIGQGGGIQASGSFRRDGRNKATTRLSSKSRSTSSP